METTFQSNKTCLQQVSKTVEQDPFKGRRDYWMPFIMMTKKSTNMKLMENNNWEITVLKNNNPKPVINGRPLSSLRNNGPKSSGC